MIVTHIFCWLFIRR